MMRRSALWSANEACREILRDAILDNCRMWATRHFGGKCSKPGDFIHMNKWVKLLKGPFFPGNFRGH